MKCRNCKKEIPNDEVFCEDCKEALRETASTKELEELEGLIQERTRVKDLEATKDLSNLTKLVKEETSTEIDEDFKDVKDNKIVTIVLIVIIGILLGIIAFGTFWFLNRPKKVEEAPKQVVDYEKVITEYGDIVSKEAKDYIEKNEEIPTWQVLNELVEYDKYEISCQVHNVYIDGSIYLQHCKVNNKSIKYTYGKLQEDAKTGKELSVYKNEDEFSDTGDTDNLVGTIVCTTTNCEFYKAFNKYVITEEKNAYYLYNYETNTLDFGPFNDFKLLNYNNELYGIYYKQDSQNNIYNVSLGKTLKNINGAISFDANYIDTGIEYKYGYVILKDNGYNFINLKTGNSSFTVKEEIKTFIEDIKSGILYITAGDTNNKFKIYNSNGKLMFNGGEFTDFKVLDNSLITFTPNSFKVYDSKLNVKTASNNYTSILRVYSDFIIVLDDKTLKIVDYSDKVIATFDREWSDNYRIFDRTFIYDQEKKIVKITVENRVDEAINYIIYSYNFIAKLTNVEEVDGIE